MQKCYKIVTNYKSVIHDIVQFQILNLMFLDHHSFFGGGGGPFLTCCRFTEQQS